MQLHEVMEHQTVSVAKAGIIANMNARTSVLACANPVGSRYNPRMSVIDNIHMPPSLLSRFDLIYLVLDKVNVSTDRKLGRHLIALFHENSPDNTKVCDACFSCNLSLLFGGDQQSLLCTCQGLSQSSMQLHRGHTLLLLRLMLVLICILLHVLVSSCSPNSSHTRALSSQQSKNEMRWVGRPV